MVHRDIKPHNLMLTDEGTIKILDFGLASLTDVSTDHTGRVAERSDLTADGSIMGTPDYISPEQAANARAVDGRSDIYSLGATFYFLLAGQPPFVAGSVMEVLKSQAELEAERITSIRDDVPPEVDDMIARLMSKDPASRFQSPSALADALAPIVEHYRADRPIVTGEQKPQPLQRAAIWSSVLVAALLLAATALGTAFYFATNPNTTTIFNFGNELNGEHANIDGAHPWGTLVKGASLNRTTKAGSYDPNAFGLFDMHGNVAEWCSDWYTPDYYDTSPLTNPTGPATGSSRVVRGGAWDSGAMYARAAAREQRAPDYRDHSLGFRVVRVNKNLVADADEVQTTK